MASRERVLVTGASGFIGSCLARDLIADGHDVHLLLRAESAAERLAGLEGHFTPQRADLRDAAAVKRAVDAARPDVVFHAAAHGTFPGPRDRATIFGSNLLGTVNLLEALERHDCRALVNAGSSSEYGHKARPIREDDSLEPRTDYAVTKAAATLLWQAEAHRGRPAVTVRIFSAYGPWEDPTRLASYVMGCCLRGEVPRVTSSGQPRDWVYADDVVALLRAAADTPAARGQILHAGGGVRHTARDLVEAVTDVCGGPMAEFGSAPPRADEPGVWVADIARTGELTGWVPRHDLRAGVRRMWNWFTERASARAA
jgi:nucleoside-diphosphate-sugar epimerase